MTTQIHRITPQNTTTTAGWLYSKNGWARFDEPVPTANVIAAGFTHWHHDQPTAPTETPMQTIAEAASTPEKAEALFAKFHGTETPKPTHAPLTIVDAFTPAHLRSYVITGGHVVTPDGLNPPNDGATPAMAKPNFNGFDPSKHGEQNLATAQVTEIVAAPATTTTSGFLKVVGSITPALAATPRTDAYIVAPGSLVVHRFGYKPGHYIDADFTRTLERELAASKAERDQLRAKDAEIAQLKERLEQEKADTSTLLGQLRGTEATIAQLRAEVERLNEYIRCSAPVDTATLRAQLAAAQEDGKRLDWLLTSPHVSRVYFNGSNQLTTRAAIDAARKEGTA